MGTRRAAALVAAARAARERAAALAALAAVGLADRRDATFGDLSGGQRQRVLVARALVQDAPVLLLDEPFSGLDAASAERLERCSRELAGEGRALLIATHDVEQARAGTACCASTAARSPSARPSEALTREVLEATYGGEIVDAAGAAAGRRAARPPPRPRPRR